MKFKPPGGELSFWSGLWILAGCFGLYLAIREGISTISFLLMLFGLFATGMWYQQKWCGWMLVVLGLLSIPLGILAMIAADSKQELILKFIRLALNCYIIYLCYQWARKEDDVVAEDL